MTSKERVLQRERDRGRMAAMELQERSAELTGTEINAADDRIPRFTAAVQTMNMLQRKAGKTDGFICVSCAGRVVRLLQNYDSSIYTEEPEELTAQWGFVWSKDPAKAKPFIKSAESPYMTGDCCVFEDTVYRSTMDNNVFSPSEYPKGWEIA